MLTILFNMLVFPGFLFLSVFALVAEFVDRKLYARFQNRMGPPWFQPLADFIKLVTKEQIIPEDAEPRIFNMLPLISGVSVVTAFLYIPLWNTNATFFFEYDLIVILYLLTIPTITFFLGGWYSVSLYSMVAAVRALTQLFAYEVPLFMSILSPAILAGSLTLSGILAFYSAHPWYWLINIPAFIVTLVAMQGKLERVPFDIPEAETEIVAGIFTEYSGRLLAFFRMAIDIEMVVLSSLAAAIYLPFGLNIGFVPGFAVYILKILFIVGILSLLKAIMARIRIDQMVMFFWYYLAPVALAQIILNLILKGVLAR